MESQENHCDSEKPLDVLIIGSGWAGLGAANYLYRKNVHNFKILEARDYIGGRSRTIELNDNITLCELGSSWVHGYHWGNPLMKVIKDVGIDTKIFRQEKERLKNIIWLCKEKEDQQQYQLLSDSEAKQIRNKFCIGRGGFLGYQRVYQAIGYERSLRSVLDDYIQKMKATPQEKAIIEWAVRSHIVDDYSGDLEDLSLLFWDSDANFKGVDLHLANDHEGGYGALATHYSSPFAERVLLNSKVISIDYHTSMVLVKYLSNGMEIIVEAKKVILTVPLGVLKAETIHFVPKFPERKMKAISRIGVGLLNKCIMLWDENDHIPWPDEVGWIEKIDYQDKQGWFTAFYSPKSLNGRKLLYLFLAGRVARRVEKLSDEAIQEEALKSLRCMYPNVSKPKQVVISRWGEDIHSKGSYTFNKVGQSPFDRRSLALPLKGRLYFAGEATNTFHFGTTHGALISGVTAARNATMPFPFNLCYL